MVDRIHPISAFGPNGCTLAFARGPGEFGVIADHISTGNGEVYRIEWPEDRPSGFSGVMIV